MRKINFVGKASISIFLILCVPGIILAETEPASDPKTEPVNWWVDGSGHQRMISLTWVHSSDNAGPNTDGIRVGFGRFGGAKNDYPWGEFWLSFREGGERDVTAAGRTSLGQSFTYQ